MTKPSMFAVVQPISFVLEYGFAVILSFHLHRSIEYEEGDKISCKWKMTKWIFGENEENGKFMLVGNQIDVH